MPPIRKERKKKTENSLADVMRDLDSSGSQKSNFKNHKTMKGNGKSFFSEGAAFLSNNGGGDNNAQGPSEDMGSIIKMYDNICQDKYKKFDNISASKIKTSKQKMSEVLNKQIESRKVLFNKFIKNLGYITSQTEKDLSAIRENQSKLEALLIQYAKMTKDAHHAINSRIEGMKKSLSTYEASVQSLEDCQKSEQEILTKDVTENMNSLHAQLAASSRKESLEHFKRTLLLSVQDV